MAPGEYAFHFVIVSLYSTPDFYFVYILPPASIIHGKIVLIHISDRHLMG